ncbi:acyl-CoA dehydrogenase family protein [Streptomyces sp. NPDC005402]|uniref:acyl-CoA dehydrogenase family protein n=1 Tax=Streptomyces sp. NPDC005402 TaxID=3155338 RepID=UPI0033AAF151
MAFGSALGDLGMVQQMPADSEIDIEASAPWSCVPPGSWTPVPPPPPSSPRCLSRIFVAEAVNRVVDRAVQICGALGISAAEAPLARVLREVRPFRIYDGPSETHRFVKARRAVRPYRQPRAGAAEG